MDAPCNRGQQHIEAIVTEAKATGAHGLKLYASLDASLLTKVIAEAQRQDVKTWAHSVTFPGAPQDVVSAGADQLIHTKGLAATGAPHIPDNFTDGVRKWTPKLQFDAIDPHSPDFTELFAHMIENETILEPALIADGDVLMQQRPLRPWQKSQRDWACEATRAAFEAGVTISAGTDFFGKPGLLFMELERLTECGLSAMQAIQAATLNNAIALGLKNQIGSIEIGKRADLLVVKGNPLIDISNLRDTLVVMKNGTIIRNEKSAGGDMK